MKRTPKIGNSVYQRECRKYYNRLIRDLHSQIFTFDPKRINAEKTEDRYFNCNIDGIRNLYSFIDILKSLLINKKNVTGIDFGCGNHYFVHDMRDTNKWDVRGYDSDKYAIELAKKQYPSNSDYYLHSDLLKSKLQLPDNSQDFVFCNAIIQHFSNEEVDYAFHEISRILKPSGIFLLIFKRNIVDWNKLQNPSVKILDKSEGKIELEDTFIQDAIQKFSKKERQKYINKHKEYLLTKRILHFFPLEQVIKIAQNSNFKVLIDINIMGDIVDLAIITYQSGRGIPNVAIFFIKDLINIEE